jgi:hypothetical protein
VLEDWMKRSTTDLFINVTKCLQSAIFEFQRMNMEMNDEDGCMLTAGWLDVLDSIRICTDN